MSEPNRNNPVVSRDWERIFEDPENGLVAAVERAPSVDAVRACADLIVSTLFSRAGDQERREAFKKLLQSVVGDVPRNGSAVAADEALAKARHRTVTLLRGIKADRVERARRAAAIAESGDGASGEKQLIGAERRIDDVDQLIAEDVDSQLTVVGAPWPTKRSSAEQRSEPDQAPVRDSSTPPATVEQALSEAIVKSLDDRFYKLRGNIDQDRGAGRLPFLLSVAFATRFQKIVDTHLMPSFCQRCGEILARLKEHEPAFWRDEVADLLLQREYRLLTWEAWQSVWLEKTTQIDTTDRVHTSDAQSAMSKERNERAADVWAQICGFSETFHAPLDDDNRLLMEIFARSAQGLETQISALLEISTKDAAATKLFEGFQRGKSVDVTLLAACYQHPEVFLEGNRPMLPVLIRAFDRRRRLESLPLTSRYLSDRM